jgi:hypothetical protein
LLPGDSQRLPGDEFFRDRDDLLPDEHAERPTRATSGGAGERTLRRL